tara:strand:+ start:513 stop:680 length:168 start_codon:yes stop_codon:yes gene_type:complete
MNNMFRGAKAFDQDLGWFVCDGVNLELAFWNTQCGPGDSNMSCCRRARRLRVRNL